MSLSAELEVALAVAREAAAIVRNFWRRPLHVQHKVGDEPVTEADLAANAHIVARLRAAFPDDALLSEELPDDLARLQARRVWMVDPIDGTRDFIAGHEGFAVMIGLCVDGRPAAGVVCQPSTGVAWAGAVGAQAFRQSGHGSRSALEPSSIAIPPGIRLVSSKSHHTQDVDRFRAALQITDELTTGGVGLKVALVAEGFRDAYVYPGRRTKIWDTCGPEAILVAAGGRVTDVDGRLLEYRSPELANQRGVLATNGPLHPLVVETLARLRAEAPGG
jgi:3'(2'), 5'-bisphosphate nucleotidase